MMVVPSSIVDSVGSAGVMGLAAMADQARARADLPDPEEPDP